MAMGGKVDLDALRAVTRIEGPSATVVALVHAAADELAMLRAKIEKSIEALNFYANEANYKSAFGTLSAREALVDRGEIARTALKELNEGVRSINHEKA